MMFRKNKFGAMQTGGFSSKLEAAVNVILKNKERDGLIDDIKIQQTVVLQDGPQDRRITYRADFSYNDLQTNETVWVEAKGFPTEIWKLKLKLWRDHGPGKLEIYSGSYQRPFLSETVHPFKAVAC